MDDPSWQSLSYNLSPYPCLTFQKGSFNSNDEDESEVGFSLLTDSFSPIASSSSPNTSDLGKADQPNQFDKVTIVDDWTESNNNLKEFSDILFKKEFEDYQSSSLHYRSPSTDTKMSFHHPAPSSNLNSGQQQQSSWGGIGKRSETEMDTFNEPNVNDQRFQPFLQGEFQSSTSYQNKRHQTGQESQLRPNFMYSSPSNVTQAHSTANAPMSSAMSSTMSHSSFGSPFEHHLEPSRVQHLSQSDFTMPTNFATNQEIVQSISAQCICGQIPCKCSSQTMVDWANPTKFKGKPNDPISNVNEFSISNSFQMSQQTFHQNPNQFTNVSEGGESRRLSAYSGNTTGNTGWKSNPSFVNEFQVNPFVPTRPPINPLVNAKSTSVPTGLTSTHPGMWGTETFSSNPNEMTGLSHRPTSTTDYHNASVMVAKSSSMLGNTSPHGSRSRYTPSSNDFSSPGMSNSADPRAFTGHSNYDGFSNVSQPGYFNYGQNTRNMSFSNLLPSFGIKSESKDKNSNWYATMTSQPITNSGSSVPNANQGSEKLISIPTIDYSTEESRWNAIVNRSHLADSHFIYGSHSTKIYCRPSCASKRPDREKVHYFQFPDAGVKAESVGFRACKRCKPGTQETADICVLAVGECLRHMTRAAILGESEEVDEKMKRKTLKQYATEFGLSAFHFHRTLKSVSTLTPGEYSKACQSLVLQDEIGIDRYGVPLSLEELNHKLRGWSSRRARRALGNVAPQSFANGLKDIKVYYFVAEQSAFGCVVVLHTLKGEEEGSMKQEDQTLFQSPEHSDQQQKTSSILSVLMGEDSIKRALIRCPNAILDEKRSKFLNEIILNLAKKGTREVQMPREILPWLRRARVFLAVKYALEPAQDQYDRLQNDDQEGGDKYDLDDEI